MPIALMPYRFIAVSLLAPFPAQKDADFLSCAAQIDCCIVLWSKGMFIHGFGAGVAFVTTVGGLVV